MYDVLAVSSGARMLITASSWMSVQTPAPHHEQLDPEHFGYQYSGCGASRIQYGNSYRSMLRSVPPLPWYHQP